jgi:hypothetical protein
MSYGLTTAMEQRFGAKLPPVAQPFAQAILGACKLRDVDPFLIYGIGQRESGWGAFLKMSTGDWGARAWTEAQITLFPHVHRVGVNKAGTPLVTPEDELGWGRGLMQLDYVDQYDWLSKNDWRNPLLNVARGVDVFLAKQAFFASKALDMPVTDGTVVTVNGWFSATFKVPAGNYPDPRPLIGGVLEACSVAAYNAAKENVLRMLVAGGIGRIDDVTTPGNLYTPRRGDYSQDVRGMAEQQRVHFMQE